MLATDIKIRFNKKKEIYYNVNYQTNYKDARREGYLMKIQKYFNH
jgi:hypothetical protein